MRKHALLLCALIGIGWLLTPAAGADGFSFGASTAAETEQAPAFTAASEQGAPAQLFELEAARTLREPPVFQARADGTALELAGTGLPENAVLYAVSAEGDELETVPTDSGVTIPDMSGQAWLVLQWTGGDTAFSVRYLIRDGGQCEFWDAAADDGQRQITRRSGSGGYQLSLSLPDVSGATLLYRADGTLLRAIVLGDRREAGTLPFTVQYDEYGRAESITAADLSHTYTYSRPLAAWLDENGTTAQNERLPAFDLNRHPSPAARELAVETIHAKETNAGIDREALWASAPTLTGLTRETGRLTFVSDADDAALTVDGEAYYSYSEGTLTREGTLFIAESPDLFPNARVSATLRRGDVTALYQEETCLSVTDSVIGATLTAQGDLALSVGAGEARYNARGNLTAVDIAGADGATLTYNRQGRLIGWAMDGYIWTRDDGWRTTAVNDKGNVIHPTAKAPSQVRLNAYPDIDIEE